MILRTLSFLLCFGLGSGALFAQLLPHPSLTELVGFWSGKLYQQEGGYAETFGFTLQIDQDGYSASGVARVYIGELMGTFAFEAQREAGGTWLFREKEVVQSKKPDHLEWCIKEYRLKLKFTTDGSILLSGPWWGNSPGGACVPGHIVLRRGDPRA